MQCPRGGFRVALAGQVQTDQSPPAQQEDRRADGGDRQADEKFEPEGMAHTLMIPGAVELGSKDTRTGAGTEYTQIEHEQ